MLGDTRTFEKRLLRGVAPRSGLGSWAPDPPVTTAARPRAVAGVSWCWSGRHQAGPGACDRWSAIGWDGYDDLRRRITKNAQEAVSAGDW